MAAEEGKSYNEEVKSKNKSTINGYIREIENKSFRNHSFYRAIPMIINYLCMKYYHVSKDRFHPQLHSKSLAVTENICRTRLIDYSIDSAFLSNIVRSGTHHWKFKLLQDLHAIVLCLGAWNNDIDTEKDPVLARVLVRDDDEDYYCFHGINVKSGLLEGGRVQEPRLERKYGRKCEKGDIIDMYLDLKTNELKYCINVQDYGKAFDVKHTQYRSMISVLIYDDLETDLEIVKLLQYNHY